MSAAASLRTNGEWQTTACHLPPAVLPRARRGRHTVNADAVTDTSRDIEHLHLHRSIITVGDSSLQYRLNRSFSGTCGDICVAEGCALSGSSSPLPNEFLEAVATASNLVV